MNSCHVGRSVTIPGCSKTLCPIEMRSMSLIKTAVLVAFSGLIVSCRAADHLTPLYPNEASCLKIYSDWGSTKNVDGGNRGAGVIHKGIDITAGYGTPVLAVAAGTVRRIRKLRPGDGSAIIIHHSFLDTGFRDSFNATYGHLNRFTVAVDDKVNVGEVIGFVEHKANVSEHLHLGIRRLDPTELVNPLAIYTGNLDPASFARAIVKISFIDLDDQIHPDGSKIIWPFACKRNR